MNYPHARMSENDVKKAFGAAIRSARLDQGISQEELADRADLHRTYVSDVERGMRNVSLENIEKLGNALRLSVSTLFSQASGSGFSAQHLEILLVEDEKRDVEMTLRAFRRARITNVVHVVNDGSAALNFLFATDAYENRKSQPNPGLVLLDLKLPNVDGLEVLQRIKADPSRKKIPVVVLTASNNARDIAECQRLGADGYIIKPVGFRNFSEVTPHLKMGWTLVKSDGHDTHGPEPR